MGGVDLRLLLLSEALHHVRARGGGRALLHHGRAGGPARAAGARHPAPAPALHVI